MSVPSNTTQRSLALIFTHSTARRVYIAHKQDGLKKFTLTVAVSLGFPLYSGGRKLESWPGGFTKQE